MSTSYRNPAAQVAEASPADISLPSQTTLVHHWMEFFRGGEAVLEQFGLLFPEAPISILVYNEKNLSASLKKHTYHTSFLQNQPFLKKHFRKLLPLFPEIVRTMKVPAGTRFVLSTDAAMMKGIRLPEGVPHVCYCHSPPRYLWGMEDAYLESSSHNNWLGRALFSAAVPRLRRFDLAMAQKVDRFIANSRCVQDRILKCYGRESVVIHPPVSLERFDATRPREDFYLIVSALVPYKCVRIAVDVCTQLNRPLVVIGTGPEENDLRKRAGKCVTFLGWQSNEAVKDHYERCKAFLFPGIEDFGITPCEAQASGAPVIAFGEGGALETVRDGVSGLFFYQQTVAALTAVIERFESMPAFDPVACRNNVLGLSPERFRAEVRNFLAAEYPASFSNHPWPEAIKSTAPAGLNLPIHPRLNLPIVSNSSDSAAKPKTQFQLRLLPADSSELTVLLVFEPGEGGVFRHVEGLVDFLLARSARVHLAYSDRRGSKRLSMLVDRVNRAGGRTMNLHVINSPEPRDAQAVWQVMKLIREIKPNIIHGHSSKAGVLARVASWVLSGSVVLYTAHAYYGMSRDPNRLRRGIYGAVETLLGRVGSTINTSVDEAAFGQHVLKVPAARRRIISNPVDTSHFHPPSPEERNAARARLGFEDHHEVVGLVARMCWQKDPETAYLAIADVARKNPHLRFVHIAWGKWKDYLLKLSHENGLEDRLLMLDYMEEPTAFYHAIDALMISSRYEGGWPYVVLEALASNLPLIAATCPGMSNIGQAGLSHVHSFASEDVAGCARATESWLSQRRAVAVPSNHRDYAMKHFAAEPCFGAVLDLYREKLTAPIALEREEKTVRATSVI